MNKPQTNARGSGFQRGALGVWLWLVLASFLLPVLLFWPLLGLVSMRCHLGAFCHGMVPLPVFLWQTRRAEKALPSWLDHLLFQLLVKPHCTAWFRPPAGVSLIAVLRRKHLNRP